MIVCHQTKWRKKKERCFRTASVGFWLTIGSRSCRLGRLHALVCAPVRTAPAATALAATPVRGHVPAVAIHVAATHVREPDGICRPTVAAAVLKQLCANASAPVYSHTTHLDTMPCREKLLLFAFQVPILLFQFSDFAVLGLNRLAFLLKQEVFKPGALDGLQ